MVTLIRQLWNRLRSWKPIHLCWWFEKHSLPIPPLFVGGQPNTHQRYFKFGTDSGNSDPDSQTWGTENANLTDQAKETPFFIRIAVSEENGYDEGNLYYYLRCSADSDIGNSFYVSTSSTVCRIVDDPGSNITDQAATDDNSVLTTTGTYQNGYYLDASDGTPKFVLGASKTTDLQFCIQFQSDAASSHTYYFWIYTNAALDNYEVVPTATTAASGTDHTLYPTDTVTISDSDPPALETGLFKTDTFSMADVSGLEPALAKTETLTITDTDPPSVERGLVQEPTDSMTLTDSDPPPFEVGLGKTDTFSITDVLAQTVDKFLVDTFSLTDAKVLGVVSTQADTVTIVDGDPPLAELGREIIEADTVGLTDSDPPPFDIGVLPTDTFAITDALEQVVEKILTEAVTITDLRAFGVATVQTDSLSITDSDPPILQSGKEVIEADTVSISDGDPPPLLVGLYKSDAVTITDGTFAKDIFGYTTDTVAITDTDPPSLDAGVGITDSFSLTDVFAQDSGKVLTDAMSLSDLSSLGVIIAPTDSVSITDTDPPDLEMGGLTKFLVDTLSMTDSTAFSVGVYKTDSLSLTDLFQAEPGLAKTDSVGIADASVLSPTKVFTESFSITDQLYSGFVLTKSDLVVITDQVYKAAGAVITDTVVISDVLVIPQIITLSDGVSITTSEPVLTLATTALGEILLVGPLPPNISSTGVLGSQRSIIGILANVTTRG